LKQIVARHEIGLGIDLDQNALRSLHRETDEALGGDAAGLLGGFG
jgi:hypothetical protein